MKDFSRKGEKSVSKLARNCFRGHFSQKFIGFNGIRL